MKKSTVFLFSTLLYLCFFLFSCQKDQEISPQETADKTTPITALIDPWGDRDPVPQPDLQVSFTTNVTASTTACGVTLPDVSCAANPPAGPPQNPHSFFATAIIQNTGTADIPPGTVELGWSLVGNSISNFIQEVTHNGIPAGGQISAISRPSFYLGPCDCAPPATNYQINLWARIDPNDLITEQNENNNQSGPFTACDGC